MLTIAKEDAERCMQNTCRKATNCLIGGDMGQVRASGFASMVCVYLLGWQCERNQQYMAHHMTRNQHECRSLGCHERPHLGGLCIEHHEEDRKKRMLEDAAVDALHRGIVDDQILESPDLREELGRIRKWWSRACDAVNYGRQDPVLLDEARWAVHWCMRLSEQIVEAERAFRRGANPDASLEFTREWVWDRFRNLEAGLRSNGVKRPE
jgi:hypothetical protein